MSNPLSLPVLFQSIPAYQQLANAEQMRPETERVLFGPILAKQTANAQQGKVQQVDRSETPREVDRDGGGQQGQQFTPQQRSKDKEPEDEALASNASPWSGNIINVKI
mgnify:CR=1 FL=1